MVKDYRNSDYSPSVKTLEKKFGSWNKAKEAAGLDIIEHGMNNDETPLVEYKRLEAPGMHMNGTGYEYVASRSGEKKDFVYIHRLLAVAEYGFVEVCDKEIHHKNRIPWDNRPENLEPLTTEEHKRLHSQQKVEKTKV